MFMKGKAKRLIYLIIILFLLCSCTATAPEVISNDFLVPSEMSLERIVEELREEFGPCDREINAYRIESAIISIERLYCYSGDACYVITIVNGDLVGVDTFRVKKKKKEE